MNFLRRRHSTSLDLDEDVNMASARTKSRKPPNTAFRQQRLKAWQPILTPKSVIPFFLVLVVIFAPLGIAILHTIYNVQILSVDYSTCNDLSSSEFAAIPSKYTSHHLKKGGDPDFKWKWNNDTSTCQVQFNIEQDIKPPIYLYYKLTNFFQNHRKYVELLDLAQLKGEAVALDSIDSNCKPLKERDDKIIYPCGLIANSYFNDTFSDPVLLNAQSDELSLVYNMSTTGILWALDRNHNYKLTKYNYTQIVPPPNWAKMFPNGYNSTNIPNLQEWEHLQNWMRVASLPSFFKLYSKNEKDTFTTGVYQVDIGYNYPTELFGGTKTLVITTNLIFGGRNLLLGVIYICVAVLCLVLGVAFLLQHLIKPRRIGDHNYLHGGNTFREAL